jgi:hypothetical protein
MWWPSPSDYQDAVQNPQVVFADVELRDGVVVSDALGLPKPISGSFATVYQVDYRGRRHAVRCFLRHVPDIAQRYAAISAYLQHAALPSTVGFSFLPQGIRLRGQWFPIVKMDWLEGSRLDVFVAQHLNDPHALLEITRQFLLLAQSLRQANIAHGDLQHGNLLVVNRQLRLLDYDGMFVPTLAGRPSNELGQPNYQHPARSARDYGPHLDNFSVWVITLSLLGLALDPDLRFGFAGGGGEALLLQHSDFVNPAQSKLLLAMQRSPHPTLRSLTQTFMPYLFVRDLNNVVPLEPNALSVLQTSNTAQLNLPDWVRERVGGVPASAAALASAATLTPAVSAATASNGADWLLDHVPPAEPQTLTGSFRAEKSLLTLIGLVIVAALALLFLGPFDPLVGAAMLMLAPLVGFVMLSIGFTVRFNDPERRNAERTVQTYEQEKFGMTRQVSDLTARRAQLEHESQDALARRVKRQTENAAQEKSALAALDRDLANALAKHDAERKKLAEQETETLAAALVEYQKQKFQRLLEAFRIADATLPGVLNRELKQNLAAAGFVTAADVTNFRVTPTKAGPLFCLVNRQGKAVYVEGITAKRGVPIFLWRRAMEARVKRLVPATLPPEMTNALTKKFQDARVSLQLADLKKKQQTEKEKTRVTEQARREQARLTREMQELPARSRRNIESVEHELAQLRKALAEKEWALILARRQLSAYAHINFFNYLKSILGL